MYKNAKISIVVALGQKREIGERGNMPWYVSEDLQHFKAATLDKCVVMGRKTFESIGRPLPKRRNIVVSATMQAVPGIEVADSLTAALELGSTTHSEIAVIGGSRMFDEALSMCDVLELTELKATFPNADTFFPEFDKSEWTLARTVPESGYLSSSSAQSGEFVQLREDGPMQYRFLTYVRSERNPQI